MTRKKKNKNQAAKKNWKKKHFLKTIGSEIFVNFIHSIGIFFGTHYVISQGDAKTLKNVALKEKNF